jgi:hypothetical protein
MYSIRGRSAATAATADHTIAQLWNPHSTQRIKVISISCYKQGAAGAAGDAWRLERTSTTGTAGSTVTPDIDAHSIRGAAPVSGVLLYLAAFTVQPTKDATDIGIGWVAPAVQGAGITMPLAGGIEIPPGAGLALVQVAATAWPASEITFTWLEDW